MVLFVVAMVLMELNLLLESIDRLKKCNRDAKFAPIMIQIARKGAFSAHIYILGCRKLVPIRY